MKDVWSISIECGYNSWDVSYVIIAMFTNKEDAIRAKEVYKKKYNKLPCDRVFVDYGVPGRMITSPLDGIYESFDEFMEKEGKELLKEVNETITKG